MLNRSFPAVFQSLEAVRELVTGFCTEGGISPMVSSELELAVNEACTNIIKHGGLSPESGSFNITAELKPGSAIITLTDQGNPYDFSNTRTIRDKTDLKEKRPPSGMGVFIIRQLVDAVMYNRIAGTTNELKLVKNLV